MGAFKEQLFRIKKREPFPLAFCILAGMMGSRSSPQQQQQQEQGRSPLSSTSMDSSYPSITEIDRCQLQHHININININNKDVYRPHLLRCR